MIVIALSLMQSLSNIVYQDEDLIVLDKPPGYHVHPPENPGRFPIPRNRILLYRVRDSLKQYVYPVHRLDVATSGLLVFALNKETASLLSQKWASEVQKKYWVVARGYLPEKEHTVSIPLESDSSDLLLDCESHFKTLAQVELPVSVHPKFQTSRYSWLEARITTGRFHQIRRHLNRISHPVIGDGSHGDSHHNRFFREKLQISGLCLRAQFLDFQHPLTGKQLNLVAPQQEKWSRIQLLFSDFDQVLNSQ